MIIGVLVEVSNLNVDKIFDYMVPMELSKDIKIGIRVEVPFANRFIEGFVLEIKNESEYDELKYIKDIVDKDVILNEELLDLGKYMKKLTLSTLISCYQIMLPKALKAKSGTNINKKYIEYYYVKNKVDGNKKLTDGQLKIYNLFNNKNYISRNELGDISISSLKTLVKNDILGVEVKEDYRLQYEDLNISIKKLTDEQTNVVNSVSFTNKTYLLHGVTGSGKTEVYMELIDKCLKMGKNSIVLVPEISLTPQMVDRFQRRFGNKIAALHSALSDGEKYDEWRKISRGEANIVIGARSAIFAPLNNIGIIIIDEEHSDSYKQDDSNPRYNAKDIAFYRSKVHNCPVILGSATPTLESYARAKKGVFTLLNLPNRVNGNKLPDVKIVDMNDEIKYSKGHFSNTLLELIQKKVSFGEQVILFLNRRGYAPYVTCKNCGYTFKCPNCDITLTYHKSSKTLRCHYCGYATKVYDTCPECNEKAINDLGVGTEKIEEELNKYLPECKVLRMDIDTTSRKGMHKKMIDAFKNHQYDILLGTQIVAKGLDFDNVTLVGVINADTSLNIPDFRSSENTFSLLSQVAGRCGRSSKKGEVIIQTYNPDHYAIQFAKNHDYIGFYNKEINIRKLLKYPPYYYICNIKISSKDLELLNKEIYKIKRALDRNLSNSLILNPTPCSIFRLNNIFRYSIIIKYKNDENLIIILNKLIDHYKSNSRIKLDINFNPSHF